MIEIETERSRTLAGLQALFASATHDASAAMCRWTDGIITVTLDEVRQVALEEIGGELQLGDKMSTMVVMTLDAERGGSMILLFDELNGRRLAASLLGQEVGAEPQWTEAEKSALMETGNILGCAYVNALTRLIGAGLCPSPPHFIQDYAASVLEQALLTQAAAGDRLLLCDIGFHRQVATLDWRVVFVPTPGLQESLQRSLHTAPATQPGNPRSLDLAK